MHEKQRFAIALGGVGGCLCIAAGIVVTGPREVTTLPVADRTVALVDRLPEVPVPSWDEVVSATPSARRTRATMASVPGRSVDEATASAVASVLSPAPPPAPSREFPNARRQTPTFQATLPAASVPLTLSHAPRASGTEFVVADDRREHSRGVVTSAFVTAGTHVGGSFRTVGRTLKRVF